MQAAGVLGTQPRRCYYNTELHHILWANACEYETFLISLTKTAVLNLVWAHTSGNPISFMDNLCISLSARGKCFLKPTRVDVCVSIDGVFSSPHFLDG